MEDPLESGPPLAVPASERRLLLADDEEGIRRVLGITLADAGYEVLTAADGEEALAVFRRERPAIVLADIRMPGMDGIELLRTIKAESPETEVILITGHGDLELAIQSLKLEATDFVTKPIQEDVLDIALKRARERLAMRRQLREYTENLKRLVRKQAARLVERERLAAVDQAIEGFSSAFRGLAGDFEGGVRFFNDLPCFVSVHDRDLVVVSANPLYESRLGDRIGRRSWEIYPERRNDPYRCPVALTVESGRSQRRQEILEAADGTRFPALVHTVPIRNRAGEVELVLEFALDISEVTRLREELRTTQERLAALGLMVSSVSHGVKGILTGLDAGLYLVGSGLSRNRPEEAREGLEIATEMVERLRRVVLDVLSFAKERPLEARRMKVAAFAEALLSMAAHKARRHGIELAAEISPEAGEFAVDEGIALSAMLNLFDNAVDACLAAADGKPHTIRLRAFGEPDAVVFEVEDDGVGMDDSVRGRLFELFFSSKGKAGTGLGLFLTRQAVLRHGGELEVRSAPGRGSCFRVRFPRTPRPAPGNPPPPP